MESSLANKFRIAKLTFTSLLIIGACGFVANNILFRQNASNGRGATALRVQVKDYEEEDLQSQPNDSITQLLNRSAKQPQNPILVKVTKSIQVQLIELGYYDGVIDGQGGPMTARAIMLYQQRNGLSQTGNASQNLLDHILYTRKITEAGDITGSITNPVQPAPLPSNPQVRKVQERLTLFGYNPGTPDGVAGSATTQAIRQFERDRSMPVTGKISRDLLRELGVS